MSKAESRTGSDKDSGSAHVQTSGMAHRHSYNGICSATSKASEATAHRETRSAARLLPFIFMISAGCLGHRVEIYKREFPSGSPHPLQPVQYARAALVGVFLVVVLHPHGHRFATAPIRVRGTEMSSKLWFTKSSVSNSTDLSELLQREFPGIEVR